MIGTRVTKTCHGNAAWKSNHRIPLTSQALPPKATSCRGSATPPPYELYPKDVEHKKREPRRKDCRFPAGTERLESHE